MDYLQHIEYSAENLQFYLWFKDYERRWTESTDDKLKALSPDWQPDMDDTTTEQFSEPARPMSTLSKVATCQVTAHAGSVRDGPKRTISTLLGSNDNDSQTLEEDDTSSFDIEFSKNDSETIKLEDFAIWQSVASVQPYRDECTRILHHYLAFNSPRELNLSHRTRVSVLDALKYTTHPSAFLPALEDVELALRGQSHPNFIRWSICNGNKPRIIFVRSLGVQGIILALVAYILLTLSHISRWYRILPALLLFIGLSTTVAAYKGLCMIMHHTHSRNLRPWEDIPTASDVEPGFIRSGNMGYDFDFKSGGINNAEDATNTEHTRFSLRTFGSGTALNDEVWVERYAKKNLLRRIFDGEVWTQDETLRMLQDQIVLGACLWAAVGTFLITVIFVAVPRGNLY